MEKTQSAQKGKKFFNAAAYHSSINVSEEGLNEEDLSCPFCKSTNRKNSIEIQRDPKIVLKECKDCNATSASRLPTQDLLHDYYSNYYNSNTERITMGRLGTFAKHIYEKSRSRIQFSDIINIIDFGGGDGSLSYEVANLMIQKNQNLTVNVYVVDYNKDVRKSTSDRINIYHKNALKDLTGKYQLVIASAIIEHIPYAVPETKLLFDLLDKQGIFYARTPWIMPFLKIFKSRIDFTYPGHVHDLGRKFWENILDLLSIQEEYELVISRPSLVEVSFKNNFFRALVSHIVKFPWFLLRNFYPFVGGWEVFIQRK